MSLWNLLSLFRDPPEADAIQWGGGGGSSRNFSWSPNPSQISGGGGSGRQSFSRTETINYFRAARKIPRECTPRPTFRKMLPKKNSFWRKINISLKLPEFREFSSHFRETWRSGLISGDSRKFRETWQVCTCTVFDLISEHALISGHPPSFEIKKKNLIF